MNIASTGFNPHAPQPTSLASLFKSIKKNRQLIFQMTKREILSRYKGSIMGLGWSLFNPFVMLTIYTFVFSEIFKIKWSGVEGLVGKTQFATIIFVGIIVLNLFSEVLIRSPGIVFSNANYVKKVVFPLEILPMVNLGAALFHCFISFSVLIIALLVFNGFIAWTIIFAPVIIISLIFLLLGFSWILSSIGVFVRDVGQAISVTMTVVTFLAPVFYPLSAVPVKFQKFILLNPPTFIIEQLRSVLILGQLPDWRGLLIYLFIGFVTAWSGYAWFQKTRKGFADVI